METSTRETAAQAACKIIGLVGFAGMSWDALETGCDVPNAVQSGDLLDQIDLPGQIIAPGGDLETNFHLFQAELCEQGGNRRVVDGYAKERSDAITTERDDPRG